MHKINSLEKRHLQGELMDDPQLEKGQHQHALRGLEKINSLSRCWTSMWNPIEKLAKTSKGSIRVLDVACGGGDSLIRMAKLASRNNLSIEFFGLDISTQALEIAKVNSEAAKVKVDFLQGSAGELQSRSQYDVVCCSLFLHHLPTGEAVAVLKQMKSAAKQMLMVQDLLRTKTGYWLARVIPKLLTRSRIVHVDGVRSVEAAFSMTEVSELARDAGLEDASLKKLWPQRFLLKWNRNPSENN